MIVHGERDDGYPKMLSDGRIALDWHTTIEAVRKGKLRINMHRRAIHDSCCGLRGFINVPWWETRGDE
jgi:hypothetical protein